MSVVAVPCLARYSVAAHAVQGVHAGAFDAVVKPVVQCEHARSTVVEPGVEMKSPMLQLLQATHKLPGERS